MEKVESVGAHVWGKKEEKIKGALEARFPLHAAAVQGDVQRVRALLGKGSEGRSLRLKADEEDDIGRTALHYAAEEGNIDVCKELLDFEPEMVSLKALGLFGSTALHLAVAKLQMSTVAFLLSREADVSLKNTSGNSPLHLAAGVGDVQIARLLLDHSADIDSKANDGKTPLLVAVQNGHRAMAGFLINHGANVNVKDDRRENALHLAASALTTHPDTIQWLIDAGTKEDETRMDDKLPLQVAYEQMIDAAVRDFRVDAPYWEDDVVLTEELALDDPSISARSESANVHDAASAAKAGLDIQAIMAKFGVTDKDMAEAKTAVGNTQ